VTWRREASVKFRSSGETFARKNSARIYGSTDSSSTMTIVSAKRSPFMKWLSREARYSEMKKAETKGTRSKDIDAIRDNASVSSFRTSLIGNNVKSLSRLLTRLEKSIVIPRRDCIRSDNYARIAIMRACTRVQEIRKGRDMISRCGSMSTLPFPDLFPINSQN